MRKILGSSAMVGLFALSFGTMPGVPLAQTFGVLVPDGVQPTQPIIAPNPTFATTGISRVPSLSQPVISQPGTVSQIIVEGNQRIEPATVQSYMTVTVGQPASPDAINDSVRALFATGLFNEAMPISRFSRRWPNCRRIARAFS